MAHRNIAPNTLDRQFNPDKPNKTWVTDITYIKTGEGWLYLSVIIDLYGRKVIARQTSRYIDRHLVCNTLKQALFRRHLPKNVLIHSDQGSQYCSADFKQLLLQYGLRQSMSRRGNCFDNAVVESFFIHSKHTLFMTVTTKRGSRLIKHYLNILKSILIGYAVIQPMAGYHLNNMNNNITKTKK